MNRFDWEQPSGTPPRVTEQYKRINRIMAETREPYLELLVTLYSRSIPTIKLDPHTSRIVETKYSDEVERQAEDIRRHMNEACKIAVESATRGL